MEGGMGMELRTCDICGKSGIYSINYSYDINENITKNTNTSDKSEGQVCIFNINGEDICNHCYDKMQKNKL